MTTVNDKAAKEKSTSEMARLMAERHSVEDNATKKIRLQLTPTQRGIYNKYQSK
jgi:hypothetical protein